MCVSSCSSNPCCFPLPLSLSPVRSLYLSLSVYLSLLSLFSLLSVTTENLWIGAMQTKWVQSPIHTDKVISWLSTTTSGSNEKWKRFSFTGVWCQMLSADRKGKEMKKMQVKTCSHFHILCGKTNGGQSVIWGRLEQLSPTSIRISRKSLHYNDPGLFRRWVCTCTRQSTYCWHGDISQCVDT